MSSLQTPMFYNDLFNRVSGKRIREFSVCKEAYSLTVDLLDKHVKLHSSLNSHYSQYVIYDGLLYLSMKNGYAQSAMDDLRYLYGVDAPSGTEFLYRLKKLKMDEVLRGFTEANDELLSSAARMGAFSKPVVCAADYTKVAYYGAFNPRVVRSKHKDGTTLFYEYASISVVENGRRVCVYSRPITLLDIKSDVLRELIEETERRGINIKTLLLDRAFFTVGCINLLKELGTQFIMPCVCNKRVKEAADSFGREGKLPFSIRDSSKNVSRFAMVVCWSRLKGRFIPFATNVKGSVKRLVKIMPREYRRRWGIETSFRKIKEMVGRTTSPLPMIRLVYFIVAMILYNIWQVVNMRLLSSGRGRMKSKTITVTAPAMMRMLIICMTEAG